MTIVQKVDSRKLKAQKAYVAAYYEDNVFFADDPKSFFQLWLLLEEHKDDWQQELQTNLMYCGIKKWLDGLFVITTDSNAKKSFTIEDIVKLVMNNITELPKCKYKLRELNMKIAVQPSTVEENI